ACSRALRGESVSRNLLFSRCARQKLVPRLRVGSRANHPRRLARPTTHRYNNCAMTEADQVTELLKRARTIAVVGLSDSPMRPSHGVSAYMQTQGYRIIPVNPQIQESLGERAYGSLSDVKEKIDIVNIFRRSEFVEEIVEQAIQLQVPAIWMQEDVIHQ